MINRGYRRLHWGRCLGGTTGKTCWQVLDVLRHGLS
ncbi:hypothetical protein PssvBMR6_gp38c [Pseudomonas phage MR6]|uniref:Uncharacterized protein n=1 Tax=Pseudomonas phage MR5 TaxID=2711172 RepID=A0A6M3TCU4_9CAUD|nr:hypothetical protein PssvBMR5_gp38c [Pseudomonas phage MR5]QJD54866.1 hypothetical protein PssvBMR6_gp38c [Pseudomonas phage MR6]QJD54926.1 hypothetical protein PssvBMR7_gp39c [Pseudomonas phage MR7]